MDILYGFSGAIANFIARISHFFHSELCFTSLSKRLRIMKFTILVTTRFCFSPEFAVRTKVTTAQQARVLIVIDNSKNRHVDLVYLSDCIVTGP